MMENNDRQILTRKQNIVEFHFFFFFYKMPFRPIVLKARKTNQKIINS